MAFNDGLIFTDLGLALQAKAEIGTELSFTRVGIGDGELGTVPIESFTNLVNELVSLDIVRLNTYENSATIGVNLTNESIETGFYWKELGLFAYDPDLDQEILYCYGNAGEFADYIAAYEDEIIEKRINILAIVGNATSVTAIINESAAFVVYPDLDDYVQKAGDTMTGNLIIPEGTSANHAVNKSQLDTKAATAGSSSQTFSVASGTSANHAVTKAQLDTKAATAGSSSQVFSVATGTSANHAVTKAQLDDNRLPVGSVVWIAVSSIPAGHRILKCNGAAISRATYADLFTVIGTTFGVGNGSTTFNIPDLRGEFVRGWDNSRGIDSGRVFGSSQADALQNITGSFYSGSYTATTTGAFSDASGGSRPDGSNETARKITFDASTVARTSTETRPRNIALLACIRY